MNRTRSGANWIGTGLLKDLIRLAALFLSAGFILVTGMKAEAAESTGADPGSDTVMILVEAQPQETDRNALLELINDIRREACEEGVNNPVNGEALTPADYVPLQWSDELEKVALQRAAESMILQDHMRPDGRDCFTAAPEGVSYTMETLAWGFESAEDAVRGWYSEKASYVGEDGNPAGHYMALINPENRFVGIAGLSAQWQRNACAAAFGGDAATAQGEAPEGKNTEVSGNETAAETGKEMVWQIPLRKDLLPKVISRALEVTAGRIFRAASF